MTNREFLTVAQAVADVVKATGTDVEGFVYDDFVAHASAALAKLDSDNAKAAQKRAEKKKENEPILAELYVVLGEGEDNAKPCSEIRTDVDNQWTVQKISSLLRAEVKEGRLGQTEIKMPKSGLVKAYYKLAD